MYVRLCMHEMFVCVSAWLKGLKRCATWHLEGSASDKDFVGYLSHMGLFIDRQLNSVLTLEGPTRPTVFC